MEALYEQLCDALLCNRAPCLYVLRHLIAPEERATLRTFARLCENESRGGGEPQ